MGSLQADSYGSTSTKQIALLQSHISYLTADPRKRQIVGSHRQMHNPIHPKRHLISLKSFIG
jgi:hypothetical protein